MNQLGGSCECRYEQHILVTQSTDERLIRWFPTAGGKCRMGGSEYPCKVARLNALPNLARGSGRRS